MVLIKVKRESINNKYYLVVRSYEKSKKGKVLSKTKWNQNSKEEYRDRIKQVGIYKEKTFNKNFQVTKLSSKTNIITYSGKGRVRSGRYQYVAKIRWQGKTYYGSSAFISARSTEREREIALTSARQNAVYQIYGMEYDKKQDLAESQIIKLEDNATISKVYYEN